jgi:signal transduction histidine kinase
MTPGSPSELSDRRRTRSRAGYAEGIRAWERRAPWYRRLTARTGLQGKLVLCFMFLLTAALAASCWLFATETRGVVDRLAGEQASEIARTLAMASEAPLDRGDAAELNRIGANLMKNRAILAVVFFDAQARVVSAASRDAEMEGAVAGFSANPRFAGELLRLQKGSSRSGGPYARLTVPVTRMAPTAALGPLSPGQAAAAAAALALGDAQAGQPRTNDAAGITAAAVRPASRLVGYLTICLSQGENASRVRNAQLTVVLIGAVAVLVSLPAMYWVVYRIFFPIRQLVEATDRIAAGDLGAQVAIHRPDVIGTLARSFNEMVRRVKVQRTELAEANDKLEQANEQLEEANRRLADANRELEGKVKGRTAELERANQRLSREIAEKEDFLRAVSHDLNAPLRNIAGMAAMLLMKHRETFDEDVIHRLERIQRNVQVETDLIGELLELSRIKTRRQRMELVYLDTLVRELGEVFAQDLETRQIRLVFDNPLPALVCERARIRQVFQNLIDNAIKYMGEGAPDEGRGQSPEVRGQEGEVRGQSSEVRDSEVKASLRTQHPALSTLVKEIHVGFADGANGPEFWVRDTGIGIEEEDLDKLFRVFRRGRSQAVQSVAGKGVGLASVKSIIETYDGTIRVESRPGHGSTFRFTIDRKYLPGPTPAGDAGKEGGPNESSRAA